MTIKVIGAGMPRTGTLSMKAALERLGYGRCYHMEEVFAEPSRSKLWTRYFSGQDVDWEEVFQGYGATVDAPGCAAWRDLVRRYPEAKVVLTQRDPEPWYQSMASTILAEGYMQSLIGSPVGEMIASMVPVLAGAPRGPLSGPPMGPPPKEAALAIQKAHDAAVIAEIPPDRLLVFRVSEGWGPLCRFLGVEVPDEPFPRLNESASFHERFRAPTGPA
jgi:hypothetical protein